MQLPIGHEGANNGAIIITRRREVLEVVNKFRGEAWTLLYFSHTSLLVETYFLFWVSIRNQKKGYFHAVMNNTLESSQHYMEPAIGLA